MTYSAQSSAKASSLGGVTGRLRAAEDWLDSRGRKAWIAAMVVGFILLWPVGLALVAYMTYANKWSNSMYKGRSFGCRHRHDGMSRHAAWRSSGNTAFDAYKADTLRRLEDEQEAFESFLQRLRDAKDKQEFDAFMEDRAKVAAAPAPAPAQDSPRGEY
ncbi:MAG: DUF2852 domain-containing protein [Rhodobacteraceae bacterium]|nr:DUF2852 domain-containing protein [Paracoccaceae bacterium]